MQQVSYISGGDAYYFSRGAVQHVRWEKASPEHPLLVYDKTGAQMLFNRGKTYLASWTTTSGPTSAISNEGTA